MKGYKAALKRLARRHHLPLSSDIGAEESVITPRSLLVHAGAVDKYLTHGVVDNQDVALAWRRLELKAPGAKKNRDMDLFVVTLSLPAASANHFALINPASLPEPLNLLFQHSLKPQLLPGSGSHRLLAEHPLEPPQLEAASEIAGKLADGVHLEITPSQQNLFTTETLDRPDLAEHLLRSALELAGR